MGRLLSLCILLMVGAAGHAQPVFPTKPLKMVIPFVPGGSTDVAGRLIAQKLSDLLGQPVIVENRAGAGGVVAADYVAKSAPDGYTFLLGTTGTLAINPGLYKKLPYDASTAFEPVGLVSNAALTFVVGADVPANNVGEFVAYAKARSGRINLGSSGSGTPPHLVGVLFANAAGFEQTHVPFKGGAPALTAVIANQVDYAFDVVHTSLQHAKAGRIKVLAVTTPTRSPVMPDVPTMAEVGYPEGIAPIWNGIVMPAGTPKEAIVRVNEALKGAAAAPDVRNRFLSLGVEPVHNTPSEFGELIRKEMAKWAELVRKSGATAD